MNLVIDRDADLRKTVELWLRPEEHQFLEALCKSYGLTKAQFVQCAVRMMLEKKFEIKPAEVIEK